MIWGFVKASTDIEAFHFCTISRRHRREITEKSRRHQAYNARMRPLPVAPEVSGDTPAERLSNALNRILKVSKADLLKKEARLKRASERKRAAKKRAS